MINTNFGLIWGNVISVIIFGLILEAIQSKLLSNHFEKTRILILATLLALPGSVILHTLFDSPSTSVETGTFSMVMLLSIISDSIKPMITGLALVWLAKRRLPIET